MLTGWDDSIVTRTIVTKRYIFVLGGIAFRQ
jgi:hypothetical protein